MMRCRYHVVLGYTPYLFAVLVASFCQGVTISNVSNGTTEQESTTEQDTTLTTTSLSQTTIASNITPTTPTGLISKPINSSAIELKWNSVSDVDKYIIKWHIYNDTKDINNRTVEGNVTNTIIIGLRAWTDYNFTVIASRNNVNSTPAITTNRTDPDAPCLPGNITLRQNNSYSSTPSLHVGWMKPSCTNGPLDGYEIYWTVMKESNNQTINKTVDRNVTTIKIDNLEPWTEYVFFVLAFNKVPEKLLRSEAANQTIRTDPSAPCPPNEITERQNNSYSLKPTLIVEWMKPNCSNGPLDGYEIYWKKQGSNERANETVNGNVTWIEIDNLEPWTEYVFFVLAFNKMASGELLRSEEMNRTKRTDPSAPCPPNEITEHQNNSYSLKPTLIVEWMKPNCSNGPLDGYEIYWKKQGSSNERANETVSGNVTWIEIDNLESWTEYVFFVLAFNKKASGELLRSEEVNRTKRTDPSAPCPPGEITVHQNNPYNSRPILTIEWMKPNCSNGPLDGYEIYWTQQGSNQRRNRTDDGNVTLIEIDNLEPWTEYIFSVLAFNKKVSGELLKSKEVNQTKETDPSVPCPPGKITLWQKESYSPQPILHVEWMKPNCTNGPLDGYEIYCMRQDGNQIINTTVKGNITFFEINNLEPWTEYVVFVLAFNNVSSELLKSDKINETFRTDPSAPCPPDEVTLHQKKRYSLEPTLRINWTKPSCMNGPLDGYEVYWMKQGNNQRRNETFDGNDTSFEIHNLKPWTEYVVSVLAFNKKAPEELLRSEEVNQTSRTDPSVPDAPFAVYAKETNSTSILVTWKSSARFPGPTKYHVITKKLNSCGITPKKDILKTRSDSPYEEVVTDLEPYTEYIISIIAETDAGPSEAVPSEPVRTLPSSPSAVDMLESNCSISSNRVFLSWLSPANPNGDIKFYLIKYTGTKDNKPKDENTYTIKASSDPCKRNTVNTTIELLRPEYTYIFSISAKVVDVEKYGPSLTTTCTLPARESEHNDSTGKLAIAIIVPIIILTTLIAGIFLYRKYGAARAHRLILRLSPRRFVKSTVMSRALPPLPVNDIIFTAKTTQTRTVKLIKFSHHVNAMMADSGLKFSQEFEEVKATSPSHPCTAAQLSDNRPKNRWINILPFDHSRVKLLPVDDEPASDYINGSYIPGFTCHREYIATQGPLPGTVDDMWRMIWEQGVNMIVMLTQCVERGKTKCEQYWPAEKQSETYGDLKVHVMCESILSEYNIRTFDLSLGGRHRVVTHLHFTKWPDFGCPENTELLINFVRAARDHMSEGDSSPLLVHCSAGVGRTGTFIAVDRLMQHILFHDYVDIFQCVLDMREHRTNMVQTEDQYIYIHECVRDLVQEKLARDRDSVKDDEIYGNISSQVTTSI